MLSGRAANSGDGQQWGIVLEMSWRGRRCKAGRGHPGDLCMGWVSLPTHQFSKENMMTTELLGNASTEQGFFPLEIASLLNPSCFTPAVFKDAVTNLRQVTGPS